MGAGGGRDLLFPISRDPPEGGTPRQTTVAGDENPRSFQFLGIPPKGELVCRGVLTAPHQNLFPISRDPPEGGTGRYR